MKILSLLLFGAVFVGCSEKPVTGEQQQQPSEQQPQTSKKVESLTFLQQTERDAAQGDAKAQSMLGLLYFIGNNPELFPSDLKDLGKTFGRDDLVPKNDAKAFEWTQKSAAQGYVLAQEQLGTMYFSVKDESNAMHWIEKAAQQGNASAQLKMAISYAQGRGIPKNAEKAAEWLQESASQGNVFAQGFLAMAFQDGVGVPKDDIKAAEWTEKAAMQGDVDSQTRLGSMYWLGRGVPTIFALVYHSESRSLSTEEQDSLRAAISTTLKEWNANDVFSGRARYVCDCAAMHLAALTAIPPRKTSGEEGIKNYCTELLNYLERK